MKENGNINVIEPKDDFKRIHKSIIRNQNIDCLTLGIYCKIVVLGVDWQLNIKGLSKVLGVSDKKVRACIGILEKEGYIKRKPNYHDHKLDGWIYDVFPEPISEEERSRAGYKKETCNEQSLEFCAEPFFSVTQNKTTLKQVMSENGKDNNIRLNIIEDLNKKEEKEIDKSISKKTNKFGLDMSFVDKTFMPIILEWLEYKKEKKQSYKQRGFNTLYKNLLEMCNGNVDVARKIVNQSMQNNYAGLFPLKQAIKYAQQSLPVGMIIAETQEERNEKFKNEKGW